MGQISLDIDIDDIISSMSTYDRREFLKELQKDGWISERCHITKNGEVESMTESGSEFDNALSKLQGNDWRLTKEEELFIINLSNRF
jgi:hypothetical protein